MKNRIWIWGVLAVLGLASCYNDEGNYTYRDPESVLPLEISGIKDTSLMVSADVKIVPEITGMTNESDYWFTWYTYELNVVGVAPSIDTLATTRELNFRMEYPAGKTYQLIFEVKEKRTGLFINKKVVMRSAPAYSDGWFVLEDENGQTDLDFVFRKDKSVKENILSSIIGARMPGKAVKIGYQDGDYYDEQENEDGSVTLLINQQALHILTTQDMKSLNMGNMTVCKNFEDEFYARPAAAAPQNLITAGGTMFLLNAGSLHTINGQSSNVGKFSFPKFGDRDLTSDMILSGSNVMCFSQETKSFVWGNSTSDKLQEFQPEKGTGTPVGIATSAMDMTPIWFMGRRGENNATKGWALMRGIAEPEKCYLADINFSGGEYPFVDFDEIAPTREIVHADVYGAHQINSIYFAKGNVLSYYQKNASDVESIEKTNLYPFPADETISYITTMSVPVPKEEGSQKESVLIVLTNSADGWKIYRFLLEGEGLSPEIVAGSEPEVYKGKGTARYVMYME